MLECKLVEWRVLKWAYMRADRLASLMADRWLACSVVQWDVDLAA